MADDVTMVIDTIKANTVGYLGGRTGTADGTVLVTTGMIIMDTLGRDSVQKCTELSANEKKYREE
jgi:hypothetical protein